MTTATRIAELPSSRYSKEQLRKYRLRPGMWVMLDEGVGILTGLKDDKADVMLVKPDGTNRLAVVAAAPAVRQAFIDEIPEPRRPEEPGDYARKES